MKHTEGKWASTYEVNCHKAHPADSFDGLNRLYQLGDPPASVPYAAVESFGFSLELAGEVIAEPLRLRLLSDGRVHDFPFRVEIEPERNKGKGSEGDPSSESSATATDNTLSS